MACLAGLQLLWSQNAYAFKPYTHSWTADQARLDAVDGNVTIHGANYPLHPAVLNALQKWPQYYNAGVIGPDGFPDLTYGQAVIHPVRTGEWLRHVFNKAWEAQTDARYGADDREQILAFTYGFLTHAAGDMWAHTLVNDFAEGVFPSVGDILQSVQAAAIAFRHIVVEGYIGDATPGFDGNPQRTQVGPSDFSDDSTPSFPLNAPHDFIYDALIDRSAATPVKAERGNYLAARGPIIGFFMELDDDIGDFAAEDPEPLEDAISAFDDTLAALAFAEENCNFEDPADAVHDFFACPIALLALGIIIPIDSAEAFHNLVTSTAEALAGEVLDAYIAAWQDDIDGGLHAWGKFGLATTRGLFDPQARRNFQNDNCAIQGLDGLDGLRANCEDSVHLPDVVLNEANPFINDHLLSMLGLPDFVGDLREIFGEISDVFEDILAYAGLPFDPVFGAIAEIKSFIGDLIKDAIEEVIGVNVETLEAFIKEPSRFLCLDGVPVTLPSPIGDVTIPLFQPETHDRLDALLGLPPGHHLLVEGENLPPECGPLGDSVEFDPDLFASAKNAITLSKLLLLDGPVLNQVLSDILGRAIATYHAGDNVMIQALDPAKTWLQLIDGDHAWRVDGQPRFGPRPEDRTGGRGNFPLWESCVLRPAFRVLFTDWENSGENFPDLGDFPTSDPVNDPLPPSSEIAAQGNIFDNGSRLFLGANHQLIVSAQDSPAGQAFPNEELGLERRTYTNPAAPGLFLASFQGEAFTISGGDGRYLVDLHSADCCHTFLDENGAQDGDPLPPENINTFEFFLDTTPPAVTCQVPPFTLTFDTDDFSTVQYTVDDGPFGSGVAGFSSVLDGFVTAFGVVTVNVGDTLDMFFLYPGTRTVAVTTADNLGNTGTSQCTFSLHATAASLINNLKRGQSLGFLPDPIVFQSLLAKLNAAQQLHLGGKHTKEHDCPLVVYR